MSVHLISLVLFVVVGSNFILGSPATTASSVLTPANQDSANIQDKKYPLTNPIVFSDGSVKYRIAVISDLDNNSVSKDETNTSISYFKQGYLTYNAENKLVLIEWDPLAEDKHLKSETSVPGQGLELSDLTTYNGKLITIDDKTGLIYGIENDVLIPWTFVARGNGNQTKGMKCEWATVKDSKLYVGSHGKETVTSDGLYYVDDMMLWVKTISMEGTVEHLNWTDNYDLLRAAVGIQFPGYLIHESCVWSDVHGRWFFLPRKESMEPFDKKKDELKGSNKLLSASPDFKNIKVMEVGDRVPNHGYSSFKFVPNTEDTVITAISTLEEGDITATFITVFIIHEDVVQVIYPEAKVSDLKFEGFEFI